ncbi:MAG: response regulator, partial [Sporomusaceae bacterium]|nr:response regulator [Sporomusaceae bacterium]
MKTVLIVTEEKKYLPLSVKENLTSASYQAKMVPADTDAINEAKTDLSAILIYADENLILQKQALIFLKDLIVMDDLPVFLMGNQEELTAVKELIPKHLIKMEFLRPVNVHTLVETIDKFLKQANADIKKKILVVDDSGAVLRSVKGWLEAKYSVALVNSGAMAIKYLAVNKPDLILLDYEMP